MMPIGIAIRTRKLRSLFVRRRVYSAIEEAEMLIRQNQGTEERFDACLDLIVRSILSNVALMVGDNEKCFNTSRHIISKLDADPRYKACFSEDDTKYIQYLHKRFISETSDLVDSDAWELARSIKVDGSSFDRRKVSGFLKYLFPCDSKYIEQFDEFFNKNLMHWKGLV